jgi:hypothetical protein
VDGLTLKRVTNNTVSATLATLDSTKGNELVPKAVTPTHVILQQSSSTNSLPTPSLYSVAKQDLGVQALAVAISGSNAVIGQAGGAVFYKSTSGLIRQINVDGSGDRLVAGSAVYLTIPFSARSFSVYTTPPLEGVLWCERVGSATDCANGRLKVLNINASAITMLGQFSQPSTYQWTDPVQGYQNTDFPFFTLDTAVVLVSHSQTTQVGVAGVGDELYVARPNVASSLVQVTPAP